MFHKLLVAVDHSPMGNRVFDQGMNLAQAMGASLVLLNVLTLEEEESPQMPVFMGPSVGYAGGISSSVMQVYQDLWQSYAERGLKLLRSLAEEATKAGVATEILQAVGSPGATICEVAQSLKVDLIVMGRRQHSRLNELLLGSASNYVVHHASCSVVIVQGQDLALPTTLSAQATSEVT